MPRATGIESETQLLVEGNDQRNFFEALVKHNSLENIQIQDFGGVTELGRFLRGFVNVPGFESVQSIGIVRDAEDSPNAAFESVRSSLRGAKLPTPRNLRERTNTSPAVAVLILPTDNEIGMLETLICRTFADTPEDQCIDGFFTCIENLPDVTIKNPDKARTHVYLATKPEPHVSVGVAAKKSYLDLDHDAYQNVHEFLHRIM